jgi:hypothetical protein
MVKQQLFGYSAASVQNLCLSLELLYILSFLYASISFSMISNILADIPKQIKYTEKT